MSPHTYYTILALAGLFVAVIIGLLVVAAGRGARKVGHGGHHKRGTHPGLDAVKDARRSITEERAIRRLEGESVPSRFDRW
jgi:hypothetical protein